MKNIMCPPFRLMCTVGLNMYETLKEMLEQAEHIFDISELTSSQNFFVTVWSLGGVIIAFAENWNFELKFFFGEFF